MRKFIWLLLVLIVVSCVQEQQNYVTISGKLKKPDISKIEIQGKDYFKEIEVNSNGVFSDTLHIKDGVFAIANGNDRVALFLKNGFNLKLEFKSENLSEGILFEGIGAETNNFIENKRTFYTGEFANPKSYFKLDKEDFDMRVAEAKNLLNSYKENIQNVDSTVVQMDTRNEEMFFGYIENNYIKMHESMVALAKGKASPLFSNYENFNGGTTSLTDLKGAYVYIDVWATWCAPCKAEIPHLKALEKDFHGKNIEFVSISVDKPEAHTTWKTMVKEQALGGVQLFADQNFESDFIMAYGINAIPRFILIDPLGNIIDADVSRPSNPKLKELFLALGI